MTSRTPLDSYLAYVAERQPGVTADRVVEAKAYAMGGFRFFSVKGALGPAAYPAAATGDIVAAIDSWEGWHTLLQADTDEGVVHDAVAWLLGGHIAIRPGAGVRPEAQPHVAAPELQRLAGGTLRFVAWYAGPSTMLDPARITVTVPPGEAGRVETTRWDELAEPDPVVRLTGQFAGADTLGKAAIARELAEVGDERAVTVLCGALQDSYEQLRHDAAVALGRIKSSSAVGCLAQALASDADWNVRIVVARALGAIGGDAAREALTQAAAKDEAPQVRSVARSLLD